MKKKWTIVAFSICITIVVGLIATIIVLASGTQGVGTSVSVLYVATDIEGTVSAKYSKVNKNTGTVISTTDMVTSSGSKTVSFLSATPTTTSLLNPTESNIALTAEQDLVITYTFTAVATYYATLEYKDNSTNASNIKFSYALNDGAYTDEMSMPIEVTPDHSTTYSIKLHIANTARNANLSGSLNWALTKDGSQTPSGGDNIDTVSISYANNEGSVVNSDTVTLNKNADGTKFKIVGPTPIIDSSSTTSYLNGNFNERTTTATGKVSSIDKLTNKNGAEFYYFCTNSAVVGSTGYNDPETIYYTSTADSTLESWYDIPTSATQLYACFMTPNYTSEALYTGRATQIIISNKVVNIPYKAFYGGKSTIVDVAIPQSVKNIGYGTSNTSYGAFKSCSKLKKVFIPNSVTSIGGYAFSGCSGLTSITIGNSVTSIGESAFSGCGNIVYNEKDNVKYLGNNINPYVVVCGVIDETKTTYTIASNARIIYDSAFSDCSALTSITIPDSVTSIGGSAFYRCIKLTSATIGSGVTSIGNSAFSGCTGLTNITIPDSVTSIGVYAFESCSGLTSITIGNSVTSIGGYTFQTCLSLTSITIGNSVTSIEENAFQSCIGLTSITIPDSVTSIGDYAFSHCTGLTNITIPDSVTSIGDEAFYGCTGLTSISVSANNSTYYSSGNCIIKISDNLLIIGCKTSIIPNTVTSIGAGAFSGCTGLTSITIGNSVTSIGNDAFYGCSNLTSVTFADISKTWTVKYSSTTISDLSVADPAQNATYLTDTYNMYTWTKNS